MRSCNPNIFRSNRMTGIVAAWQRFDLHYADGTHLRGFTGIDQARASFARARVHRHRRANLLASVHTAREMTRTPAKKYARTHAVKEHADSRFRINLHSHPRPHTRARARAHVPGRAVDGGGGGGGDGGGCILSTFHRPCKILLR